MKNVQIPEELFLKICDYIFSPEYSQHKLEDIKIGLQAKLDAFERRQMFSEYKTSPRGTEQRETARKAYLNHEEIPTDWQSAKESYYED
jgi:hypothetical protein